jgi:hypothetical protein
LVNGKYEFVTNKPWPGGHEQLISNSAGRFKPAFAERDKKPTMIDLRNLDKLFLKTIYVPP